MKDKSRIIKCIFILFFSFFLIVCLYSVFSSANIKEISINSLFYLAGRLAGLIGFFFLSFLIFFGDTARFFDKFFGLDKIITFNKRFGLTAILFVILHPIFFMLSTKTISNYLIPDFAVKSLSLGIIAFYLLIIISISSALYKRISYQIWQYLHIIIYILFFFALYHAVKLGSDSGSLLIKSIYLIILLAVSAGIIYRTYCKLKEKNIFKVKEIKWISADTFTLVLNPEKKFSFKAGQWCFLRINKDKLYARHPFSISSEPNKRDIDFTIKIAGRFTKAASQLKEGEEVIVDGPFGIFTVEDNQKDLVFIAGGIGITPFMSIIRERLKSKDSNKNIILIYCCRKLDQIIFKQELDSIKEKWFKQVCVLSEEDVALENYEKGFFDKTHIDKYVKNHKDSLFYICGPEKMKSHVLNILKDIKIKKSNIFIEDFFW